MIRSNDILILTAIAGLLALSLMLGVRLISPARFAQATGGGLLGLCLLKLALVLGRGGYV